MRILVDSGDYKCINLGDLAMLQTTTSRLRTLLPDATIQVLTESPDALARHCPGTVPVSCRGREVWMADRDILGRLHRALPLRLSTAVVHAKHSLRKHVPALLTPLVLMRLNAQDRRQFFEFFDTVRSTDVLVLAGAGGFTDHVPGWSRWVMDLIDTATHCGRPAFLFSQGMGPVNDARLLADMRATLPKPLFIGVREGLKTPSLLKQVGVSSSRVYVTGDDAIDMAYSRRPVGPGSAVGINLRISRSSAVSADLIPVIGRELHKFACRNNASLMPAPIDVLVDLRTIDELLKCGDAPVASSTDGYSSPQDVIAAIGRCRVVATGAYHTAVFALSMGIPVVGLTRSAYFWDKFAGLRHQFGPGCTIVDLNEMGFPERMQTALQDMWNSAEQLRPGLLQRAEQQVRLSYRAYEIVNDLIAARPSTGPSPAMSRRQVA